MNVTQLNLMLMEARATAIGARREALLTEAQAHREDAAMYSRMGLYSVAARETIKAVCAERLAQALAASAVEVLL